jgi:hypothetical protein
VVVRKTMKPKTEPIKTIEIEVEIAKYYNKRINIIVPNITWGLLSHECDMLIIRPSNIAIEVEIKISVSDFKADLLKHHHHKERQNRISEFYYAMPKNIYEKVKDLIPIDAGVITCERYKYEHYSKYGKKIFSNGIHTKKVKSAIKIKNARKLTLEEKLKIGHLGCMRIFNLKEKIINLTNRETIV